MTNEHTHQSWYPDEVKANLTRQIARLTSQLEAMQPGSVKYRATTQIIDATTRALASL